MNSDRRVLQVGAVVILCALFFRLLSGSVMETTAGPLGAQDLFKIVLFLETGRPFRSPAAVEETAPAPTTAPTETQIAETQAVLAEKEELPPVTATFSPSDTSLVSVQNSTDYAIDPASSLLQPLSWELTGEAPTVLILHTHGSESYVNNEGYPEASPYRTLEEAYSVVSVGDRLAENLTRLGIPVLHDRTLHDYPSYNGAYTLARETVSRYLKDYPSIQLVLDLHRDAVTDAAGNQVGHALSTDAGSAAISSFSPKG